MADVEAEEILRVVARAGEMGSRVPDDFVVFRPRVWSVVVQLTAVSSVALLFGVAATWVATAAWRQSNAGVGVFAGVMALLAVSGVFAARKCLRQLFGRDESRRDVLVVTKDRVVSREDGEITSCSLIETPFAFQVRNRRGATVLLLGREPFGSSSSVPVLGSTDGYALDEVEAAINAARLKRLLAEG